jgi:NADPH:quinone reductase-like Zn-dependent oxidoreductase
MYSVQLAALSGLDVIATASPRNFDLLKSLGAKYVFDYNSPSVIEDIRRVAGDRLKYLVDCHALDDSTQRAIEALSETGGAVVTMLFVDESILDKKIKIYTPLLYKISGKAFPFRGGEIAASLQDKKWGEEWCPRISKLLADRKIRGNPIKVMGGLDAVAEGFKYMAEGKVHAEKLVFEVAKE